MTDARDIPLRDRPIAVFDSGVGGLTVLKALREALPSEHFVYVGDTARVPYGSKSPATVTRYATQITRWLMRSPVKCLVIACNTASSVALGTLTDVLDPTGTVPVIGVIGPSAHAAVTVAGPGGKIAVVGTEGTIRRAAYQRALMALDKTVDVVARPCPLFVPLAEEGWHDDSVTVEIAHRYLDEICDWQPNALVLGCTHYPLLKGAITQVMGPKVALLDSAHPTSVEVRALLKSRNLLRSGEGSARFFVTDGPERFGRSGERFLGQPLGKISQVVVDELGG